MGKSNSKLKPEVVEELTRKTYCECPGDCRGAAGGVMGSALPPGLAAPPGRCRGERRLLRGRSRGGRRLGRALLEEFRDWPGRRKKPIRQQRHGERQRASGTRWFFYENHPPWPISEPPGTAGPGPHPARQRRPPEHRALPRRPPAPAPSILPPGCPAPGTQAPPRGLSSPRCFPRARQQLPEQGAERLGGFQSLGALVGGVPFVIAL